MAVKRSKARAKSTRSIKTNTPVGQPLTSGVQVYTGQYSDTGQAITPQAALACSTVNACVQAIATELSKLPWSVMTDGASGRSILRDHPVHRLLRLEATPYMSAMVWRELMLTSACLTGNGYSLIERDASGRPMALHYLRPDLMLVQRMPNGELAYIYSGVIDSGRAVYSSHDIFHLMWMSPDGLLGYSPISLARQAIGVALAAEAFGASYWRNASRPSGILSTDKELSPDAIMRMRESWEQRMKGVHSAGAVAVLEQGLKYQPISLSPQDSQWLEGRGYQREEICSIFRVPPSVIGVGNKQSYASAEQANREYVTNCLSSWAARLEAEAQRKLFRRDEPLTTEISFDALLRADLMTRYRSFSIARQFGFMSVNEIRAEIGRPSIGPAGDTYLQPVNMIPAATPYGGDNFSEIAKPVPQPDELPDESMDDTGEERAADFIRADSYTPTEAMREEAQRGLDWRSEHGRGGTEVGIARARDIVNGKDLPLDTVMRMVSFFARHEVDKQAEGFSPGEKGYPSNGRIAWALWGGDAGKSWADNIADSVERDALARQIGLA